MAGLPGWQCWRPGLCRQCTAERSPRFWGCSPQGRHSLTNGFRGDMGVFGLWRHKGPVCSGCGSGCLGHKLSIWGSWMLSLPGAGRKCFHPRYIPMTPRVWTGHPCIPLLSFKRCLRGLGDLNPRPCPYTPQSPVYVLDGTYPQETAAAQVPVFTTSCIFSHLAPAGMCGPFLALPSPHCSCRPQQAFLFFPAAHAHPSF